MIIINVDLDLGSSLNWWIKNDGVLLLIVVVLFYTSWEPLSILVLLPLLSIKVLNLNSCKELRAFSITAIIASLLVEELGNLV